MATDASFEKIQTILPHENADSLEIAIVSNYPCVVRKGEFHEGDLCFYIRDDAKLTGFDQYKEYLDMVNESRKNGSMVPCECFHSNYPYQDGLMKYLGSGGRVKSIKLRGKTSMGILLKPEVVSRNNGNMFCCYSFINEENYRGINTLIKDDERGSSFLKENFGVEHWEAPIGSVGIMNVAYQGLPEGLRVSDEENWESLDETDLHLGSLGIVTQKYDGSSCTVTCYPDGKYEISCRRMTFGEETDPDKMNSYQKLSQGAVKAGLWWAKKHNEVIAFRGEACCGAFNKSSFNIDCNKNSFFVYGCNFPNKKNYYEKNGLYGTNFHFTKIVEECNGNGFDLKSVDVLEKDVVITKELLSKYNERSYKLGEGAVIGVRVENINLIPVSDCWHYKSKSREYLLKMG